jgi:hypothetical protein
VRRDISAPRLLANVDDGSPVRSPGDWPASEGARRLPQQHRSVQAVGGVDGPHGLLRMRLGAARIGEMPSEKTLMFMFCNSGVDSADEVVRIDLSCDWTDAVATYWGHGSCLAEATHEEVPLYLLRLRGGVAVFGQRGSRDRRVMARAWNVR